MDECKVSFRALIRDYYRMQRNSVKVAPPAKDASATNSMYSMGKIIGRMLRYVRFDL